MAEQSEKKLYVDLIKKGTVIDHIKSGYALSVLKILRLDGKDDRLITVAMNVKSKSSDTGKKDIVKVANTYLDETQINQIALISPNCSVSLIEDYEVKEKFVVEVPETIHGIIPCPNEKCVTNKKREPISTEFDVITQYPLKISCIYCDRILKRPDVLKIIEKMR